MDLREVKTIVSGTIPERIGTEPSSCPLIGWKTLLWFREQVNVSTVLSCDKVLTVCENIFFLQRIADTTFTICTKQIFRLVL